jgi:predicted RNA-binding Zn ribbon-like protein
MVLMVIDPDLSLSRAGSLPLVGGSLALDFANTESGRGFATHQNHLLEASNVVDWLDHTHALPPEDTRWLRAEISARVDLARDVVAGAIALRSAIHDVGAAIARRSAPPEVSLAALSAQYARCMERASLSAGTASYHWRWSLRDAPIEAALGPIALAAVRLFTEGDFGRIKECRGHACGWLFCDTSKNNRRRWCEMEVCGNRAKQRRLAARRRGA